MTKPDTDRLDLAIKRGINFGNRLFCYTDNRGLRKLVTHEGNHRRELSRILDEEKTKKAEG